MVANDMAIDAGYDPPFTITHHFRDGDPVPHMIELVVEWTRWRPLREADPALAARMQASVAERGQQPSHHPLRSRP